MNWSRTIALVIAVRHRVELRRRRKHPQLGFAVLLGATFGTLSIVGQLPLPRYERLWPEPGAYHYGTLAATHPDAVLALAREVAAVAIVVIAGLASLTAVVSDDWEDPPVELVTAVPLPAAILGVLGDELLESAWFVGPVAIGGGLAFTAGTGRLVTVVGTAVGAAAVVATGLLAGTAAGLGFRTAIRRSPRLYGARYAVGAVTLFLTFMGLGISRAAGAALARSPLGWYGDLLLATTPAVPTASGRVLLALAAAGGVLATALAAVVATARSLWFAETVLDDGTVDADGSRSRFEPFLARLVAPRTAAVVRATWRRIRRSPRAMIYVLLPFALVGPASVELSASRPGFVPVLVTLYAASAVGMGTTLNPLGNERVALPAILTTPGGRTSVLHGHAVAALLPGAPFVVAAAVVTGLFGGYPPAALLALVVAALALVVAGVGVSLGVGALLPNLEGPANATLVPPELYAMFAYLLAMSVVASPSLAGFGDAAFGHSPPTSAAVATVLTVALAAVAGTAGYRYAARTLERFEADGVEN